MLEQAGLREVEEECKKLHIQFHLLRGDSKVCVPDLVKSLNLDGVVADFSPLRVPLSWVEHVKNALPADVPFCQVSLHSPMYFPKIYQKDAPFVPIRWMPII